MTVAKPDPLHIHKTNEIRYLPDTFTNGVRYIILHICKCGKKTAIDLVTKDKILEVVK